MGFVGLAETCGAIARGLEDGVAVAFNSEAWQSVHSAIRDKRLPASCRALLAKCEAR